MKQYNSFKWKIKSQFYQQAVFDSKKNCKVVVKHLMEGELQ